jgi:hypothetical protein
MPARFRLPAEGIEGFRLDSLDGRALGNVAAVDRHGADLLVLLPHGDDLRPLDWDDVVWIDPVKRSLLVTRDASRTLATAGPVQAPRPQHRRSRRRTAGLIAAALGLLSLLSVLVQAGGADQKTPIWALVASAAIFFVAASVLLVRRRPTHLPPTTVHLRTAQKGS